MKLQEKVVGHEDDWHDLQSPSALDTGAEPTEEPTISTGDALKTLRRDRELTRAALLVPLPMIYFCVYVLMLVVHIPTAGLFKQNNALYTTLASSGSTSVTNDSPMLFFNIATTADIFNWLKLTLVPNVFVTQNYNSDDLPIDQWGRIATYNQALGAMTLKFTYGAEEYCDNQEFLNSIYQSCYSTEDSWEVTEFLEITENATDVVEIIESLKNGRWLNESTEELKITVVTFNGEIGAYGVTILTFEFQEGGFIKPSATTTGAASNPYAGSKPFVVDALLGVCFLVVLGHQLVRLWRNRRGLLAHLSDFWHLVDYASSVLIAAFYGVWALIVDTTHDPTFRTLISGSSAATTNWKDDETAVNDLDSMISSLEQIGSLTVALRLIATITIILLGVRILDRFRFHPRLNLLSHTVSRSLAKFGAFGFVFLIIIVTFALSGHFIFGDRAKEFSTVKRSLEACVNMLFGNFDYKSIQGLLVPVSVIYYWCYLIIGTLILLNMMLAIVLDTYEEVSKEAFKDKTITSMKRIASIAVYDVQVWLYDATVCGCIRKRHRLSRKLAGELNGNSLTRREVVFRGRIRPDVLEVMLASNAGEIEDGAGEPTSELVKLTPLKLRSIFANALVSDTEARATIDYLAYGLAPRQNADKNSKGVPANGDPQHREQRVSANGTKRQAIGATLSPVHEANAHPLGASSSTEAQQLAQRMEEFESKLELVLAHVMPN